MALFKELTKEEQKAPPFIEPPKPLTDTVKVKIEPTCFDGITVDTEYVPSSAILVWGQGSLWTVDYYSQILGKSNEPRPLDTHLSPIEQQYRYLKKVPLKVTSALSFSQQDNQTNTMQVTGGGYTFPFLTPNMGDMFVADVGDGKAGLFAITRVERATILKDSVYNVEWVMVGNATMDKLHNLAEKVQATYYYSQSSLESGCGPFVTTELAATIERYDSILNELIRRYFTEFLSIEHNTLLVPDQQFKTYDPFIVKTLLKMVSSSMEPRIRKVKELNVMGSKLFSQETVWDSILNAEWRTDGTLIKTHLVNTRHFKGNPNLQAMGYTGIPRVVCPKGLSADMDTHYRTETALEGYVFKEGKPKYQVGEYVPQSKRNHAFFKTLPKDIDAVPAWMKPADIHPVVKDEYYVFSEAFYKRTDGQSKLELLVNQFINREALHKERLDSVLSRVYDWDRLEQFYYYPVLLALLRTQTR